MALTHKEIDCIVENVYSSWYTIGCMCGIPDTDKYLKLPEEKRMKKMLTDWNHDGARKIILGALEENDEHWAILAFARKFDPKSVEHDTKYSLIDTIDWLKKHSKGEPLSEINNSYWRDCGLTDVDLYHSRHNYHDAKEYIHDCASKTAHRCLVNVL
jgi:hypothetical protein